jgi:hypothetical protein
VYCWRCVPPESAVIQREAARDLATQRVADRGTLDDDYPDAIDREMTLIEEGSVA